MPPTSAAALVGLHCATSTVAQADGIPDECDICNETVPDCNLNFVPDACDIVAGTSCDGNNDGIPDDCQPPSYGHGACCLSYNPGDCISTTECACNAQGVWFFGIHSKCNLIDCETAPMSPQGP